VPVLYVLDLFGLEIENLGNLSNRVCDQWVNSPFTNNLDRSIELPSQSCIASSHGPFFSVIVCIGGLIKVLSFHVAFRGSIETTNHLDTLRFWTTDPKSLRSREESDLALLGAAFERASILP
jgi:hypothetical protein